MTVSIPLVVIFGILVFVAYRHMGLRAWHAIAALIFGFLLAATTAAPEIHSLLSSLVNWLNKP
jgi:VanZ family protein